MQARAEGQQTELLARFKGATRQSQTSGHWVSSPGRVETIASPLALCSQGPPDAAEGNASFPFWEKHLMLSGRRLGLAEAVNTGPLHSLQPQCLAGLCLILLPLTSLQSCQREEAEPKEGEALAQPHQDPAAFIWGDGKASL